jgi:hypothetical protein
MKARLILDRRVTISENAFVELVLWEVPEPVPASPHRFKYRLALVANSECILRYDNEAIMSISAKAKRPINLSMWIV